MIISFEQSLTVQECIALFADVAGELAHLGRPAQLERVAFDLRYDSNGRVSFEWPCAARYEGDGVVVDVDIESITDGGNPRDGYAYNCNFTCTVPNAIGFRMQDTNMSPANMRLFLHLDDCPLPLFDELRPVVARHAKGATDRTDVDWIAESNAEAATKAGRLDDAAVFRSRAWTEKR